MLQQASARNRNFVCQAENDLKTEERFDLQVTAKNSQPNGSSEPGRGATLVLNDETRCS